MKTTKKTKCVRPIKKTPARQPRPSQSKKCNITKTASKDLNVLDDAHFKLSSPAATQKHVIRRKLYKTVYIAYSQKKKEIHAVRLFLIWRFKILQKLMPWWACSDTLFCSLSGEALMLIFDFCYDVSYVWIVDFTVFSWSLPVLFLLHSISRLNFFQIHKPCLRAAISKMFHP